jgi:UDP-glucuronate 4-epimerase
MRILVTGAAGFIGGHVADSLSKSGHDVFGIDNLSSYYSPEMKKAHARVIDLEDLRFGDITDRDFVFHEINQIAPDHVIHLAAQGGVRASREDPLPYLMSNQVGFLNVLQACESVNVKKLIYASSSSVYGPEAKAPFTEDSVLHAPKSLYAISKLANENIARNLQFQTTQRIGLRFFTVYGPWGRPDMAMFRLIASAMLDQTFSLSAHLDTKRDFTFVSDVAQCIVAIIDSTAIMEKSTVLNVAGGNPYTLGELLEILQEMGLSTRIKNTSADSMDLQLTHGSVERIRELGLPVPSTSLREGVRKTMEWFQSQSQEDIRLWLDYSSSR